MASQTAMTRRIIDDLYTEAMVLADEARAHFDPSRGEAIALSAELMVAQSCESLKVTTRLMHCIAWLLNQKAYFSGELTALQRDAAKRALGHTPDSDPHLVARFPEQTRAIIVASEILNRRIDRLSAHNALAGIPEHAVHRMLEKISTAF